MVMPQVGGFPNAACRQAASVKCSSWDSNRLLIHNRDRAAIGNRNPSCDPWCASRKLRVRFESNYPSSFRTKAYVNHIANFNFASAFSRHNLCSFDFPSGPVSKASQ
jgi:hypothetical protein